MDKSLYNYLKNTQGFQSQEIGSAFELVDRSDFVRSDFADLAYQDAALPIGFGSTISQPSTVLFMLNRLDPRPGEKILDLGSGSGWTTALLAKTVGNGGKIYAVEVIPELVAWSFDNLSKYHFGNIKIFQAGKALGLASEAPYDKILVSAAAERLPGELVSQLKVSGRMVLPIGNSIWQIDKLSHTILRTEFEGFAFVPLK